MRIYPMRLGTVRATGAPVTGCLLRTADDVHVLVDTGYPREAAGPPRDGAPVRLEPDDYVGAQLAGIGLKPEDIEIVICTHLDPDHAGNHDAFPDAEFVVQRTHYEWATSTGEPRIANTRARWDLPHLKYRLVDGDVTLLPGIDLIETGGHVPGHQSVLVHLERTGPVIIAADAIPTAAHVDPDTRELTPYDLDEAAVRASTRKLVELARQTGALILRGHETEQWSRLNLAPEYYD